MEKPKESPLEILTARDREVLSLIMAGLNNREIADRLKLNHQTIRNRVSKMYKKVGVRKKRTGLILWAVKGGFERSEDIAPWLEGGQ